MVVLASVVMVPLAMMVAVVEVVTTEVVERDVAGSVGVADQATPLAL